jgi:hypothetical protein
VHPLRSQLRTQLRYLRYDVRARRLILLTAGGLLLLAVIWLVVTGLLVRQQVRKLETSLRQVQTYFAAGDLQHAREAAALIPGQAHQAHLLTSGPAWWVAAHVPYLGDPIETVRGATGAGMTLGRDGIPDLLDVATRLDPAKVRVKGDTLDLTALRAAAPELQQATVALTDAQRQVDSLPSSTWLGAVDSRRASLASQLRTLTGYITAADRAARILPTMLGAKTPQRYFIGMQNEAEMRGTGGLPGAFAIAVASHGTVRFTHFASDAELEPAATRQLVHTGLDFGKQYGAAFAQSLPTSSFLNSNVSPNFPYAAQVWARMWEQVSGEHVDGAVAVDPTVLGYILAATGPVSLPNSGMVVNAQNVVPLTQRDEYTLFTDNVARKAFLVAVLKATSHALISGRGSASVLARLMVSASEQQRLQVWSSDAAVESELAATSYGAVLGAGDRPLAAPVLNNMSGGKLDYYLTRTLTYHRSGCGSSRDVLVTLTLTDNAPPYGLPPYVTDRLDANQPANSRPGDYSTLLDYYATSGAQLLSVRVNGTPATAAAYTVDGRPMYRLQVQLRRGTTQTIELHMQEPPGAGSPLIWRQPGVTPMSVTAYSQSCG